jgi:hypothetical protein
MLTGFKRRKSKKNSTKTSTKETGNNRLFKDKKRDFLNNI